MDDEIMTPREAADALRVSRDLIYRLIRAGRLKAQRVGFGKGLLRIRRGDLAEATLPRLGRPPKE